MFQPVSSHRAFRLQEKTTIAGKKKTRAEFVGSFNDLNQLPRNQRPHIAVAGRSNVGKSSLLNCLVGQRKLAKVSATPGKTRSLNFFSIDEKYYLVDLPGYGYAKVARTIKDQWGKLIERYLNEETRLVGLIFLLDCRREPVGDDLQLLAWLSGRELPVMVAVTKADKLGSDKMSRKMRDLEHELGLPSIAFSAVTGMGKEELMNAVRRLVASTREKVTPHG
jgi:GTP-binding protein